MLLPLKECNLSLLHDSQIMCRLNKTPCWPPQGIDLRSPGPQAAGEHCQTVLLCSRKYRSPQVSPCKNTLEVFLRKLFTSIFSRWIFKSRPEHETFLFSATWNVDLSCMSLHFFCYQGYAHCYKQSLSIQQRWHRDFIATRDHVIWVLLSGFRSDLLWWEWWHHHRKKVQDEWEEVEGWLSTHK